MAKRGGPKKNGVRPAWMTFRDLMAIYRFNQARRAKEKYSVALTEAVKVQSEFPI